MFKYIMLCSVLFVIVGLSIGNPSFDKCVEQQGADVCHAKHY